MSDAVITDLDGTLCDVSGILHHLEGEERNFAAFHAASADCPPRAEVADAVRAAHGAGKAVLVVTSREFVWRDLTLDWLVAHEIPYDQLVMRIVGDYRADDIVKAESLGGVGGQCRHRRAVGVARHHGAPRLRRHARIRRGGRRTPR